ncbi:DUF1559 domain-containing protein [Singulisphaera sp. Ch08]|uniref:DUF1559 domain-containing protein n=1 Tax=Singulisphaera sp. Ch08 TaxID=3120278 RepID=A0AAU7CF61_9BACT
MLTGFSVQSRLLPYLEQAAVYDSINFSIESNLPGYFPKGNGTAASTRVAVFFCPSDPETRGIGYAPISYRASAGTCDEGESNETGAFVHPKRTLKPADFLDGLSSTLAFSEKPIGFSAQQELRLFATGFN